MEVSESGPLPARPDLVIITGLSGSGKGTVLRVFEDLGYFAVDNLPIALIPKFAELTQDSSHIRCSALVVDIREGESLRDFPSMYTRLRNKLNPRLLYLEAEDASLMRRFSETRRPHPLGTDIPVGANIQHEREALKEIRGMADHIIDTSKFSVHELRDVIRDTFSKGSDNSSLLVNVVSFGFRHGVPTDADLVFDVRFLPNPNYVPEFKARTGLHAGVADYIRGYPQTQEFMDRVTGLLEFLLPHYVREGKSYLTIAFGCTGGQHRSVMMASEMQSRLSALGYKVKETHRDMPR
jgi:RNase adapter protein RapZ